MIKKAGLGKHAKAIRAAAKPAFELVPVKAKAALGYGVSRFGGQPDFPAGDGEWPQAMQFLAELNFAQLDGAALGLPPDGLISYFVENGEDEDGDYLGTGHVQLDRRIPKSGVWRLPTPKRVKASAWFGLRFEPRLTLPCVGTSEFAPLEFTAHELAAWDDVVWSAWKHPKHQLMGCKTTDLDDDPDEVLLLSLASDAKLGWKWGDGNRLDFRLRRRDFAKGKLAEAWPHYVDA